MKLLRQPNKCIFVHFLVPFCYNSSTKSLMNKTLIQAEEESEEHIMKKLNFYFFEMLIQKQTHFNIKAYIAQTIEVFL